MLFPSEGEAVLRKQILKDFPDVPDARAAEKDIAALATVLVTSETPDHPVDHAFDDSRGPGGSRWVADAPGQQRLALVFDTPQTLRTLTLEIEELVTSRTQELAVTISRDGGRTYQELLRQEYNFSPPGTTFEREVWTLGAEGVTHLQLTIKPDKGCNPCYATLTSFILQ
jgi:hypothetical protein